MCAMTQSMSGTNEAPNFRESPECELRLYSVLGNSCRLSPMKIAPVPSQHPVVDTVLIGSPLLVVLRSGALVTHPDLLHHPSRGWVAPQVLRVDAVQPYPLEPVAHDLPGGLRGVPTAPVRPPYPVAQLGVVVSGVRVQRDGTYQLTFLAQNDGPGEGFPCLVGGTEKSDPLLGHAVFVGVGHDRKRTRHLPFADEALHVKCVLRRELSKCEPGGVQFGVGFHTPSYPYSPTFGEGEFSEVRHGGRSEAAVHWARCLRNHRCGGLDGESVPSRRGIDGAGRPHPRGMDGTLPEATRGTASALVTPAERDEGGCHPVPSRPGRCRLRRRQLRRVAARAAWYRVSRSYPRTRLWRLPAAYVVDPGPDHARRAARRRLGDSGTGGKSRGSCWWRIHGRGRRRGASRRRRASLAGRLYRRYARLDTPADARPQRSVPRPAAGPSGCLRPVVLRPSRPTHPPRCLRTRPGHRLRVRRRRHPRAA